MPNKKQWENVIWCRQHLKMMNIIRFNQKLLTQFLWIVNLIFNIDLSKFSCVCQLKQCMHIIICCRLKSNLIVFYYMYLWQRVSWKKLDLHNTTLTKMFVSFAKQLCWKMQLAWMGETITEGCTSTQLHKLSWYLPSECCIESLRRSFIRPFVTLRKRSRSILPN
jgi:hypothetical protein